MISVREMRHRKASIVLVVFFTLLFLGNLGVDGIGEGATLAQADPPASNPACYLVNFVPPYFLQGGVEEGPRRPKGPWRRAAVLR